MQPTPIQYTPGDCILLIGPAEFLLKRMEMFRVAGLRPALLCSDQPDLAQLPRGLRALPGQLADLTGWMGAFSARMKTLQGPADLAPLSFHEDGHFDWVLDFSATPQATTSVPPLGYYALAADDFAGLKRALLEIAGRVRGGFEKPRYFSLDTQVCAHSRQGVAGCNACLSVCAAGAITSEKESIRIEPHLCQGCGSCALVCPSGAVRYVHPAPSSSLSGLRTLQVDWNAEGRGPAGLWIVDAAMATETPSGWLPFVVPEPASLGLEFWLTALASGFERVAIAAKLVPMETRHALEAQLALGQNLLTGLGFPPSLGRADHLNDLDALPTMPSLPAADLPISDDKRVMLYVALDALIAQAPKSPVSIPLAAGPMGEVQIAAEKCTLCAACVGICPSGAISLPGTTLQLAFTEGRCLQCGLCANVCPEQAVTMVPRLLTSSTARNAPRIIAEAESFACTGCAKPFATRAMIDRSRAMMASHPMFQGERARLMTLCPDCRQKAMAGVQI